MCEVYEMLPGAVTLHNALEHVANLPQVPCTMGSFTDPMRTLSCMQTLEPAMHVTPHLLNPKYDAPCQAPLSTTGVRHVWTAERGRPQLPGYSPRGPLVTDTEHWRWDPAMQPWGPQSVVGVQGKWISTEVHGKWKAAQSTGGGTQPCSHGALNL
eukprot:1160727-Pelagomonas_calceolata.AAC.17